MAFDQSNQSPQQRQSGPPPPTTTNTENGQPELSLPPINTSSWDYNGYNTNPRPLESSTFSSTYTAPAQPLSQSSVQQDYAPREIYNSNYTPSSPRHHWEQSSQVYAASSRDYPLAYTASQPPAQRHIQSNAPYDPVRSNYTINTASEALSPPQRSQSVISPVMSISQLLSSNNNDEEMKANYSPSESPQKAKLPYGLSESVEKPSPPAVYSQPAAVIRTETTVLPTSVPNANAKVEPSSAISPPASFNPHASPTINEPVRTIITEQTQAKPSQPLRSPILMQYQQQTPAATAVAPLVAPELQQQHNMHNPTERRSNGIQNLLNSEPDEQYQMADSDTDTEDIPLIKSPRFEGLLQHQNASKQSITKRSNEHSNSEEAVMGAEKSDNDEMELIDDDEEDGDDEDEETPFNITEDDATNMVSMQHNKEREENEDTDTSLDEFSDIEMANNKMTKPIIKHSLQQMPGQLEDDSEDDDEVLLTHREEMLQFMMEVHKRKRRVIEEYERKEAIRRSRIRNRIEHYYEKRYGSRIPRSEIFKRKMKQTLHRRTKQLFSDGDTTDTEIHTGVVDDPRDAAKRRLEDERKNIWLTIARKDIPRMTRILSRVQATRSGNCKKIAQYCQKEIRRAATNGGRANREMQNKAKRLSKEMLLFWKKNEKEERELRKKAEKEALDKLKQEEERREAQRQARKLNFLITQTELYSHFIGRKIKQDTEEDEETAQPAPSGLSTPLEPVAPSDELDENAGITNVGEVDFDEEDEAVLKEKARLSAQNALAKQRERTKAFDEGALERRRAAGDNVDMNQMDLDDMNFQEPSSMGLGPEVTQPNMLMCQLKSYQLKGLNWLANLYEQGINGILADEMGLGKTVQSISLLAYLAEVHNIWGPFLVIAPASTLHNWQQEFTKFVPQFRALPYWGNPKDRKVLRQFWNRKQLYGKDAPFHIVITSYQLVLTDVSYFQRVKWQYMILDEAQAIKSSSSARWKQLLGFHCRNRLLLTGTPIQNSMQELWALLHFIMPTLFDSHEEFSEWFSKDIESHAENRGSLNQHQLRRLHMILKPFMLRRIKRNVQHELGEKIEVEVFCELTARQRALYRGLKEKISISELLEKATSLSDVENMDSLMNLVMQFRKVCNHPELFERGDVMSPMSFCNFSETGSLAKEQSLYCPYSASSLIKYHIPKRLYRNGGILNTVGPESNAGFRRKYFGNMLSIWTPKHIFDSAFSNKQGAAFSFLRFTDLSPQEASYLFSASLLQKWLDHLARRHQQARRQLYKEQDKNLSSLFIISQNTRAISPLTTNPESPLYALTHVFDRFIHDTHIFGQFYLPAINTVPVDILCDDISFTREKQDLLFNANTRACLFGEPHYMNEREPRTRSDLINVVRQTEQGILTVPTSGYGYSWMRVPSMKDLILDSGKLATLDKLLEKLKPEGHRCLIYFQMTRMIDLFEEYINYKQYKYLRLDGSSKISDRRDMVQDWQTRPEIFIFLLSTRAGGLGINLTAADTVIFYDSDWNPTVDQQAMDRAHRLGQTKQVTVYRLITKGTIEERILQRAKQKDEIQKVVISGGEFRQVDFKPREIVSLLLDDEELDDKLQLQLKRKAEEEEKKKAARGTKRSRKQALAEGESTGSTPVLSPANVDRLFSAGEDIIQPDDDTANGSSAPSKKKTRIGRPRTNFSFTG
ncbi:SNF2 family N-terminal domain-containing protein [Mycotypha africana]|uniref:SNF2 family N-terminal domain-containing protein n=1 Tax=Mycotypha africana TaxID=64632 RepID=UPI00230115CC|nr:SNF2 family N-terminal domain-containing protein [Mycotypha africana]KAI8967388.1 SNF2 family N-terminal domain-containing protein [Mycotypha africana]